MRGLFAAAVIAATLLGQLRVSEGAAHVFDVTWDGASSRWTVDGVSAPALRLATGATVTFHVRSQAPPRFFVAGDDDCNETSALRATDGVSAANLCANCDIIFTPLAEDADSTVFYCSDDHTDAGNNITLLQCSSLGSQTDCTGLYGCGWNASACLLCNAIVARDACAAAVGCGWCLDNNACAAATETTCSTFASDGSEPGIVVPFWAWIIVGVGGAVIAAAVIVAIAVSARKRKVRRENETMFRLEDQMSVLGGRTTDDFTL